MNQEKTVRLKKSNYNVVLTSTQSSVRIVYNTLQDSLTLIKGNRFNIQDIEIFHQQGILVNQGIDERSVYRYRLNTQKFSGQRLHLFLTITGLCNCNCQYCFAKDSLPQHALRQADIPLILQFIRSQIESHSIKRINVDFFGGEPFTCEGIYLSLMEQISTLANQYSATVEYQFYTNATLRPRLGYKVFDNYNVRFLITLDGLKEVHDSLRPMKNNSSCFDAIISNLTEIKNTEKKAVIRINFGKQNLTSIPQLLDQIIENGLNSFPIEFYPIQNMSCGSADYSDAVDLEALPKMSEYIWNEASKRGIPVGLRPASACCYCTAFTNRMFVIDPDLNVYKCALLQCDIKNSIGNLKKNTDYLRDSVFYDWMAYDPSQEDSCKDCVALPVCSGGCGGSGTFRFGTHRHANCYDLSPVMLQKRIAHYIKQHYASVLREFSQSSRNVLVLEKANNPIP